MILPQPRGLASTEKAFLLWVHVVDWHDGDTFHGVIDHGMRIYRGRLDKPVRCRCALINAPELDSPDGPDALEVAREAAPPGEYPCWSYKPTTDDTFGRPLLDLVLPTGELFSQYMLEEGWAVPYKATLPPPPPLQDNPRIMEDFGQGG